VVGGGEAAYRGFLFADLRGYTAFGERHGDRAAADLLDAYRVLVRQEVARHAGAEIRTEGDSFYVVFPSARHAVACGLQLIAAADQYSQGHEDAPLRIGVGINAGETVQRGEAFVGTAVNLAARLCSEARSGEVLVTATVRAAVHGESDVRFVRRGAKRLKGIADPVEVFAVVPATHKQRRRPIAASVTFPSAHTVPVALLVVGLAVIFATTGAWLAGIRLPGSAEATPTASAAVVIGSRSATPSGSLAEPDAYPTASEEELLARLDPEIARHCDRADADDRPRLNVDRVLAGLGGSGLARIQIPITAGLACAIPSPSAPSALNYWGTASLLDFNPVGLAEAMILSDAATFEIPPGDCASERPAYGRWEFGGVEGRLLCRTVYGDAVLEWTYDGVPIVAVATRRDGDDDALFRWWRDHARFLRDG
jgi:class 3 adenylate cyclase